MKILNFTLIIILSSLIFVGCSEKHSDNLSVSLSEASISSDVHNTSSVSESNSYSSNSPEISEKNNDASKIYQLGKKYFVSRLNNNDMNAFEDIYTAVLNFEERVVFRNSISSDTLDNLMLLINYDCPELIHLKGDYAPIYTDETEQNTSAVALYYNMDINAYKKNLNDIQKYFNSLRAILKGKDEYECEKYIYNQIFTNCIYDENSENSGSVYGALIEHKARCEGISKAFMWCMRELGYECITVVGIPGWSVNSAYSTHSWNILNIDGKWYHIDITVDNLNTDPSENNPPLYGFFNTDDSFTYKSRALVPYYASFDLPKCEDNSLNYHQLNDLIVSSGSDIEKRLYEILDTHFTPNITNVISIKLESINDFNKALGLWQRWADKYIDDNNLGAYDNTVYYNQISSTVVIQFLTE